MIYSTSQDNNIQGSNKLDVKSNDYNWLLFGKDIASTRSNKKV